MKHKAALFTGIFFYCGLVYSFSSLLFTPRDDLKAALIQLIKQERRSIYGAMYMFTDKDIAQELTSAYVRGVKVKMILDQISMNERYGKGLLLKNNGVDVYVFASKYRPYFMPIMHNKFFVFGYNEPYKRGIVWSGSFNCTQSAGKIHCENVIVSDDIQLCKDYQNCFDMLLKDNRISQI